MIRQCCQCKKVWHMGKWVELTALPKEVNLVQDDVSHGYCEECFITQMRIIHGLNKLTKPVTKKVANPFFF